MKRVKAANGWFCELWAADDTLQGYAWGSSIEDARRFAQEDRARWDRIAGA